MQHFVFTLRHGDAWRRLRFPAELTLDVFGDAILIAYGWEAEGWVDFLDANGTNFYDLAGITEEDEDEAVVSSLVATLGPAFIFSIDDDFGRAVTGTVHLEQQSSQDENDGDGLRLLAAEGIVPPLDLEDPTDFPALLAAYRDRLHPDHHAALTFLGVDYPLSPKLDELNHELGTVLAPAPEMLSLVSEMVDALSGEQAAAEREPGEFTLRFDWLAQTHGIRLVEEGNVHDLPPAVYEAIYEVDDALYEGTVAALLPELERLVRTFPDQPVLRVSLVTARGAVGDTDRAVALLRELARLDHAADTPFLLRFLELMPDALLEEVFDRMPHPPELTALTAGVDGRFTVDDFVQFETGAVRYDLLRDDGASAIARLRRLRQFGLPLAFLEPIRQLLGGYLADSAS